MSQSKSKIGAHKIRLSTVDSTNNFAAKLINEGLCDHGSVILAENQTNGRGQRGSEWQSLEKQNILTSFIFEFKSLDPHDLFRVNAYVSIAILDFLNNLNIDASIKWPNDILVNGKKICGILIENKLTGTTLTHSVAGFGLNVNQVEFVDLNAATSLRLENQKEYNIEFLWLDLISSFRKWEDFLISDNKKENLQEMYKNNLFGLNELRRFKIGPKIIQGKIKGIDVQGHLLLEIGEAVHSFQNKEIVYLS